MEKKFYKKFFIIGIIILFVGASVFPVVSSVQTENKKITYETPKHQAFPIIARSCKFNITFYGNVTRYYPIVWGNITIFQRAVSTDSSSGLVGKITIINRLGNEYNYEFQEYIRFRGWVIFGLKSNLPPGQESHGGYISGWAMLLIIAH